MTKEAQMPADGAVVPVALIARPFERVWDNIRSGDLGIWPVIIGLVVISAFFYSKNPNYASATNLNNLIVQMAGVTMIAFGVVFVLLLGEIDLSVGYLSGVAGVVVAEFQLAGSNHQLPGLIAILLALLAGALFGVIQGSIIAFIGVPSFIVTLAGLLAAEGIILKGLPQQLIVIQNNTVNNVANYYFSHTAGWIVAGALSAAYALVVLGGIAMRKRVGATVKNVPFSLFKVVALTAATFLLVLWSNRDSARGVPFAGLLMVILFVSLTFLAKKTTFGRHVYAVGGNAEAARRAGINVARIRIIVFALSGTMAALGGIVFAARLSSVQASAGGGTILLDAIAAAVIGGTSLFGGRGEVKSALLGALIIAMIANGIDMVGYSTYVKYWVTAAILLAAVIIDTVSRKRQLAAGR